MNFSYRVMDAIGIVRVHASRIDAAVAIQFKDRFAEVTGAAGSRGGNRATTLSDGLVLLDLTEVEFLDSSGLGAVVAARKLLGQDRGLALCGLQPAVDKVMRLTHMDRVFPIYPDADACLADHKARRRA